MKIRVPSYLKEFNCIASKCEDTCCAGWGIVIDDDTFEKYKKVESGFGKRLKEEIIEDGEEKIFVLNKNNCSFLNDDKLCDIYSELGEEYLCYTCRQYPRYTEEFGSLREVGISLSCPEAARIILKNSNLNTFELNKNDEEVNSYNDINANLFLNLIQCRKVIFDLLKNKNIDFNLRLGLILIFTNEIQKKIDENNINDISKIREKYLDDKFLKDEINKLKKYKHNEKEKYEELYEVIQTFKGLKHISENDLLGLEGPLRYFWHAENDAQTYLKASMEFEKMYIHNQYKFENILTYYIFRYFMKSVFDYDVLAKVKLSIISYIVIKELAIVRFLEEKVFKEEDMIEIAHTYSKDIEHLEENIETLSEKFEIDYIFKLDKFLYLIMN